MHLLPIWIFYRYRAGPNHLKTHWNALIHDKITRVASNDVFSTYFFPIPFLAVRFILFSFVWNRIPLQQRRYIWQNNYNSIKRGYLSVFFFNFPQFNSNNSLVWNKLPINKHVIFDKTNSVILGKMFFISFFPISILTECFIEFVLFETEFN